MEIESGVSQPVLDDLLARLLKAFVAKRAQGLDILTAAGVKHRGKDIDDDGTLTSDEKKRRTDALLQKRGNYDVKIWGQVQPESEHLFLHFTGYDRHGKLVVQTSPQAIPRSGPTHAALSLNAALGQAASYLVNKTDGLETVLLGGIHYQDCGTQPPFALQLKDLLKQKLWEGAWNPFTRQKLKVKELVVNVRSPAGLRTLGFVSSEARSPAAPENAAKTLTGAYRVYQDSVDLTLQLSDTAGIGATWSGRIRRAGLYEADLRSDECPQKLREGDGVGPFAFRLLSNRGPNPAYRLGENVSLGFTVGIDAWIYCFNKQADGKVIQIMPNPHSWKKPERLKFAAGKVHYMSDPDMFPFVFKAKPPLGTDVIKCFATDRDVTARLPEAMQGRNLKPLPADLAEDLTAPFRRLHKVKVSEASLVLTIVE